MTIEDGEPAGWFELPSDQPDADAPDPMPVRTVVIPLKIRCPERCACDRCLRQIERGFPVRMTNGAGQTSDWMHPACYWHRYFPLLERLSA